MYEDGNLGSFGLSVTKSSRLGPLTWRQRHLASKTELVGKGWILDDEKHWRYRNLKIHFFWNVTLVCWLRGSGLWKNRRVHFFRIKFVRQGITIFRNVGKCSFNNTNDTFLQICTFSSTGVTSDRVSKTKNYNNVLSSEKTLLTYLLTFLLTFLLTYFLTYLLTYLITYFLTYLLS